MAAICGATMGSAAVSAINVDDGLAPAALTANFPAASEARRVRGAGLLRAADQLVDADTVKQPFGIAM